MIAAPLEYRASPAAPGVPLADLGEGPCWDPDRQDGFLALDLDTRTVSVIAEVEADRPGNRMNDAACDRTGRMFAGTKAEDDTPGAGSLYRLEPDHRLTTMLTGVTVLDYEPATGGGGNRRPFAELPSGKAVPDGLAVDAGGVPVLRATSCAFGGPCVDVLYITTAAGPGRAPGGDGLFACRPGHTGMPANPYRG